MNTDLVKISCRHAKKCPGCPQILFVYAKQIHHKQKQLEEIFGNIAGRNGIKVSSVIRSPLLSGYRTSSKLALHQDNFARRSIGIYERASKDVVDIADCPVHAPEINDYVQKIFRAGKIPFEFYNHSKKAFQENRLKFVTIRIGSAPKEAGIIVSHTGVDANDLKAWALQAFPKNLSVWGCQISRDDRDLILTDKITHLAGPELLGFKVGDLDFRLHPASFFQANASLSRLFLEQICIGLKGKGLLDLYGGFGAYSLTLADKFEKIYLVDGNSDAVESAKKYAVDHGISNLSGHAKYCEAFLKNMTPTERAQMTHIITNPPRAGLTDTVRSFLNRGQFPNLQSLTYVSCNPQTLKRDLDDLLSKGRSQLESIQPFDMFPQTNHVETVVRLRFS